MPNSEHLRAEMQFSFSTVMQMWRMWHRTRPATSVIYTYCDISHSMRRMYRNAGNTPLQWRLWVSFCECYKLNFTVQHYVRCTKELLAQNACQGRKPFHEIFGHVMILLLGLPSMFTQKCAGSTFSEAYTSAWDNNLAQISIICLNA